MQTIEVQSKSSPEVTAAILGIDKESFYGQYEDAEKYYQEALELQENINVLLKEGEKIVGYLLAIPHHVAYEELKGDDLEMGDDSDRYYVETLAVDPIHRGERGYLKLVLAMIDEAGKRGIKKFSFHCRVDNGLSRVVQKYFRDIITSVRRIDRWKYYDYKEPADYIEATVKD